MAKSNSTTKQKSSHKTAEERLAEKRAKSTATIEMVKKAGEDKHRDDAIRRRRNELTLPDSVGHVLHDHQYQLMKVKGVIACALGTGDGDPDATGVILCALEAALDLITPVVERMETAALSWDAAKFEAEQSAEVSHG